MPESRQETALKELKKALRKVVAYEPTPKPQKNPQPKVDHRLSIKGKVRKVPSPS